MKFNEDTRVKIPSIIHLTRLGYTYLSLKNLIFDETSNIIPFIFRKSLQKINSAATAKEIDRLLGDLGLLNHQQNQELAQLRDWLLPLLINWQVRVRDGRA